MKIFTKTFYKSFLLIIILLTPIGSALAQDTVFVQTLKFDDITKRQGIWTFPDTTQSFRKILMFYTLKCDPRTTHDKYDCGEWDYLTYNIVNVHTGKPDSTKLTAPLYKVGATAPDTIQYTTKPTYSNYQRYQYSTIIDSMLSENIYKVFESDKEIALNNKPSRYQFVLLKPELKALGYTKGRIDKIKLKIKDIGGELKNFTIKIVGTSLTGLQTFDNENMKIAFQHDVIFTSPGWYEFNLTTPFNWTGFNNLLVEISYDSTIGTVPNVLFGIDSIRGVQATVENYYLYFDGVNDYVDCGNIDALNGTSAFTFEGWVRIDQWEAWNTIFTKAGKISIETGGTAGDLYCEVRNPDNTYGYATGAVGINQWNHIAMVYDGTQDSNQKRLKLYVNGIKQSLIFSGDIPSATPVNDLSFSLTSLLSGSASALKGGLDEVRVWNAALRDSTIAKWMYKSVDQTHPDYANLILYYPLNENQGTDIIDHSPNKNNGKMIGVPVWKKYTSSELYTNTQILNFTPDLSLVQGTYISHSDSLLFTNTVQNPQISIAEYVIKNYNPVINNIIYAWLSGYGYSYDATGKKVDSTYYPAEQTLKNDTLKYFGQPY
ncbi:MAG: LamG domain-containing protein, partial [FCB group bacterium]